MPAPLSLFYRPPQFDKHLLALALRQALVAVSLVVLRYPAHGFAQLRSLVRHASGKIAGRRQKRK